MDPIICYSRPVQLNFDSKQDYELSLETFDFWPYQVLTIILFSMIAILSLGSNIVTIIVLMKSNHFSSKLSPFLINLSAADIAKSMFTIPFAYTGFMLGKWVLPLYMCPVVFFVESLTQFVFVWILTVLSIDR
jgi:somatostatin receptor 2/somatostatin receptor 5